MKSNTICVYLCMLIIIYTQLIGYFLNDSEIKGIGLIGLILLVVVLITKIRG